MSRASRVPRRTYPSDLSGQWRALQNDPLLARFAASRERLACDPYRPLYHFTSPENALNDPNGLCFWQGRWHLFYQGYPPEDPRQHWGHAVSDDLIHWQDLPYAIYPDPEECCFSGATLVEPDRVLAMYHGTECGNMLAVSDDPLLLRWRKLTGGPVIPMRSADGAPLPYSVFDPCIWKKGEAYYALSGGTLPHPVTGRRTRAEFLFRSEDLVHWTYLHPFLEGDGFGRPGDDGACPYFWPLGERHLLLHFSHMSGGKYLIGDYDRDRDVFRVCNGGSFNSGSWYAGGVHAPSAAPDGQGGVIAIWNLNVGKPTPGWDQVMSLPRRLTLTGAYRDELAIEPAGNTDALRTAHVHVGETALPAGREVVLDGVEGDVLELRAVFDPRNVPALELNAARARPAGGHPHSVLPPARQYQLGNVRRDGLDRGARQPACSGRHVRLAAAGRGDPRA